MPAGDTTLVTGASGFVGAAVARALIREGARVRLLVRPTSRRDNVAGLDAEICEGDLNDVGSLERALAGTKYLYHVAADYRMWVRDPAAMLATNARGTENIMRAAMRAGVERIVYTSSVATLAARTDGSAVDESHPSNETDAIGPYKRSKVAAERIVERLVAHEKLPAIIVNPSTPIGPRDIKPTPTGRIIVEAACGKMPGYVDTGLNLVHVDDVAAGHLAAMRQGRIGERYILGGDDVTLATMLTEIAGLCGRPPPRLRVPRRLVYPIAVMAETAARFSGREPFATVDGLRMAKYKMYFSSLKAKAYLGYQPRPSIEGLRDGLEWFRLNGYLRAAA